MAVSRPHYFTGQFLKQSDFLLEQEYHKKLNRLHNRYHHTVGVVTGLKVTHRAGTIDVTVSDGVAIDRQGRTIVLDAVDTVKSFSGKAAGNYYVVISYEKEFADETEETGVKGFTRVNEKSLLEITTGAPDTTSNKIALAKIIVEDNAGTKSIKSVDTSVRNISGAIAGESLTIAKNPSTVVGDHALKVDGDAYITGKVGIGKAPSAVNLDVAGTVKANYVQVGNSQYNDGYMELSATKPYIDFHHGESGGDYNMRIINNANKSLSIEGGSLTIQENLNVGKTAKVGYLRINPQNTASEGGELQLGGSGANPSWQLDAYKSRFRIHSGGEKMTILSNGNVGVGKSNPVAKLDINGFSRTLGMSVNNGANSGVGRGLWLWAPNDSNHVIYSSNPSGKTPANTKPAAGYFNAGHRLRLRTYTGQGFLFENQAEQALVDIDSSNGRLWTKGAMYAGNSDIYFTHKSHHHTGIGNTPGFAAIENSSNYDALMILGRAGTSQGRRVKMWDTVYVHGSFYNQSDKRLKTNIKPIKNSLLKIKSLEGVQYNWKKNDMGAEEQVGLLAQQVEEVFPSVVSTDQKGVKSINYIGLTGPIIEAIKEQQNIIENLKGESAKQHDLLKEVQNKQGGADFAEYFKSKSGDVIKPGTAVVVKNSLIEEAKKGETPFGVISANPGLIGGAFHEWPGKFLKDAFGNDIVEEYEEEIKTQKTEKVKHERQKAKTKTIEEDVVEMVEKKVDGKMVMVEVTKKEKREVDEPQYKEIEIVDEKSKEVIRTEQVPIMETFEVEEPVYDENGEPVMIGTGKFEKKTRQKLNPKYDPKREYVPRDQRPEWNIVGLVGQIPLRKGQPTAPGWVKLKDIDKDVELWLVK